ncbi:carbohydrate ABC transporter permease [Paenibacillus eucommiae]|uniref:Multiple sugar transport system permease protein n=1 Tax=Paenibacillus eucommiae TaxID=1355755 RepID=A0ABS4J435_9BACL|nr:carbohydrate ABC transporter permease [Paenibacillus eucommiae]MBP1994573.1 multiple sugar transport system permease protein [Paenibacillus eucommiae]
MIKTHFLKNSLFYFIICLGALVMLVPFYWLVATSLKTGGAILKLPPQWFPNPITWENYATAWSKVNFARYTFNSALIVVIDMVGVLLSCSMVAFGFAMFNFKFKKLIIMVMLATMMLPSQVTSIPTYFIWKNFGALNSYFPLTVPSFLGGAFGIFLVHQHYKSLPRELYEAALIDGFSPWGVLWRIYFPLSKPVLSALGVFTFIGAWSNTYGPLLYLHDKKLYTLPLGLLYLNSAGSDSVHIPLIMAGAVIITLPVVIVFLFAQRHFVQGLASTGVKG